MARFELSAKCSVINVPLKNLNVSVGFGRPKREDRRDRDYHQYQTPMHNPM